MSGPSPPTRHAGQERRAMTERLADITARIEGIRQLGAVVNAMRGIAAARAQQARTQLAAVDGYAAIDRRRHRQRRFPAAVGSAGRRSPIDAAGAGPVLRRAGLCRRLQRTGAGRGRRRSRRRRNSSWSARAAARSAAERDVAAGWKSAMPSHSPGIPKLADRIAEALYARIATGEIDRLDADLQPMAARRGHAYRTPPAVSARHDGVSATGRSQRAAARTWRPRLLLSELTADYLHAQLCHAALHAFAAENEARMEAMASARHQIERQLSALQATQRTRAAGGDHGRNHRTRRGRDREPFSPSLTPKGAAQPR